MVYFSFGNIGQSCKQLKYEEYTIYGLYVNFTTHKDYAIKKFVTDHHTN